MYHVADTLDFGRLTVNAGWKGLRVIKHATPISSSRALVDHPRNVPDDVLRLLAANGGLVMVNYAPPYVSDAYRRCSADLAAEQTRLNPPPLGGLLIGHPVKAGATLAEWKREHPMPRVTLSEVADHIEHVAKVAGVDHVGIGSDFDGVGGHLPAGLEDVSTYPALLAELMRRGWSDADCRKVAGENMLRVMTRAEEVATSIRGELPRTDVVPPTSDHQPSGNLAP